MQIVARCFWLPKAGHSPDEYEDAFWPKIDVEEDVKQFRAAVADGATETSFAGFWAQLLVQSYCKESNCLTTTRLLKLQRQWHEHVQAKPLPWYAEEKARSGAFSSLIGLNVGQSPKCKPSGGVYGTWDAIAIGDSCLFHIRNDKLLQAFPVDRSGAFGSRPALISSNPDGNADLGRTLSCASGRWQDGDAFYLMTDALACWFLAEYEIGGKPWIDIRDLGAKENDAFEELMRQLRDAGAIRNDDVTLLRIDAI